MANVTIPDLTALAANVADGDLLEIADISNSNASRKVTRLEIIGAGSTGITTVGTVATGTWNAGTVAPASNDGFALGSATVSWSDLFLASGGVVNWNNGNVGLTHNNAGTFLLVNPGDLRVTSANVGTNADSVPTLSSTSTLTNKTLTSPTVTGTWDFSSATVTFGTVSITTINATSIVFEGATPDAFETTLAVTDPTADRTINLPNASGDVVLTSSGVLLSNITLGESAGQIVLDPTLSADGTYSGIVEAGTAGATLAFGDVVYFAAADSRWELADASAASTSGAVKVGMCVLAAASDGSATTILLVGKIRADAAFPTLTVSAPVYISETAGDVTNTAPTTTDSVTRVLGFGVDANTLYFKPDNIYVTFL